MVLPKKVTKILFDLTKKNKGKAFGSLEIRNLKGEIVYKVYYEMLGAEKYSNEVAYIKLVFNNKTEVEISPLTKLKEAFKKSNAVGMMRYEFEDKKTPKYLYILRVGDSFFDLTEEMAKKISQQLKVKINSYP